MVATSDPLREYRSKRSAGRTPEPFGPAGKAPPGRPGRFVVQKHAARRLHYDFRLELGGVLVSWAVPRGPSPDPAEKRLAVHVEDHPLEYAGFEGLIPRDNYGAGAVIIWDQGIWTPVEDPVEGLRRGKLLFDLRGYKLRGRWTLVRTRGKGNEWLLIKKADAWANPPGPLAEESVLSGLAVEDLPEAGRRAVTLQASLERQGAPRLRGTIADVKLMLAEARAQPFSAAGWVFELKYDGYRLLASREDKSSRLRFRGGRDATATFPEIARALASLPFDPLLLDGELVVLDESGRPSFQHLQRRVHLSRPADVDRASVEQPATLYCFDLPVCGDRDLRPLPLAERRRALEQVVPRSGPLQLAIQVEGRGEDFFREIERLGFEGMIAKKADTPYRAGRSPAWVKVRAQRTDDFVVIGFTRPKGSRTGFGALHLGVFDRGVLTYAGRVGSGFTERQLAAVAKQLEAAPRVPSPAGARSGPGHVWVAPGIVCEVRYTEWTDEGRLRQPVFLRFRDDKPIEECVRAETYAAPAEPEPVATPEPAAPTVELTNLDKVFWPDKGYTKGDLIEYHRRIAPWMLPYLRDRPLVLTRYPDGIAGKSFYQKDAPGFVPEWLRTERIWSEHAGREIDYFVCDDLESLLYVINLGTIPIHVWSSRTVSIQRPDWCVLDLDPKEAPFAHVVRVAREIHDLCEQLGLDDFIKTSGASGLHVMIPLGGQCTYDQSRTLGELMSRVIVGRLPDIATITRTIRSREGKVYLDYLQNRHGQTIAAPFAVRPLPGAPVSTPLLWKEVGPRLDPKRFTIRTVPARMRRRPDDPLLPVLDRHPDLLAALDRLGRLPSR